MKIETPKPVIHACVLAAGASSRYGATKLVQDLHDTPLVQHVLVAAQGACARRVWLVVGHDQENVVAASAGLCENIVVNDEYRAGIGTSIARGVAACRDGADAILIALADQPLITAAHLNEIIVSWSGKDREIVSSCFDGITCPPILFPRTAFDALTGLTGDSGAKALLASGDFDVRSIDFPPAGFDVDTPDDLRRLRES